MMDDLDLVRETVSCLCGISVSMISDRDDSVGELVRGAFSGGAVYATVIGQIKDYLAGLEAECVYQLSGLLGMNYIMIRLPDAHRYLCVGPCRMAEFSEGRIRSALRSYKLSDREVRQIISYCRWQPVLPHEKLHQLGILLARRVLGLPEPVRYRHIEYHWMDTEHPRFLVPDRYVEQSRIRQIELRYEASAALTEAVKQGNLSLALRMLQGIYSGATSMVRNPDPLRNAQNMCIILNTQLRHAMEERRIHPYRLDMVSGEIGREIENLKALDQMSNFCANIIRRYCDLALEKNYAHLDPLARQAVMYVKNHLTDNLTVKETAEQLLVNANYLSGKFHEQVGMTFTDFVNQQRAEQAASLLKHTNMQIQQIAAAVGYNNTSYFAKQFQRFQGVSPRQYRKTGRH